MVCAQASMWTASRFMHHRYGAPRLLPPEITEHAFKNLSWNGPPLPTDGLSLYHMVNAFSNMGYMPLFQDFEQQFGRRRTDLSADETAADEKRRAMEVLRYIVPYLESEFPVVLVFPGHAVCAVGYVIGAELLTKTCYTHRLADWITGIVVNDDATGPYRVLPRTGAVSRTMSSGAYRDNIGTPSLSSAVAAIVPLPQRVYTPAAYVEEHVSDLLRSSDHQLIKHLVGVSRSASGETRDEGCARSCEIIEREWMPAWERRNGDRLTMRTYLVDAVDYLRGLSTDDYAGFSRRVREIYLQIEWPRRVWVTEILANSTMTDSRRRVLGEVISDPTTNRYESPVLSIHIPGAVFVEVAGSEGIQHDLWPIEDDSTYSFGTAETSPRQGRSRGSR